MTTLRTSPKSKLGIDLQAFRTDRPDEWRMDEFTREAEAMNEQNKALIEALEHIKKHQEVMAGEDKMILSKLAVYNIAVKALDATA